MGFTARSVRDWANEDVPVPRNDDGSYNLHECIQWYAARQSGSGNLKLQAERARLAKEQADKYARENAIGDGEVLEVGLVEQTWLDLFTAVRARILSLPTKVAAELAAMSDANRVRNRLYAEVEEILLECSQYEPGIDSAGTGHANGHDSEAPAAPNGKRVGRRQAAAESGE